jgi:hypothetical protein
MAVFQVAQKTWYSDSVLPLEIQNFEHDEGSVTLNLPGSDTAILEAGKCQGLSCFPAFPIPLISVNSVNSVKTLHALASFVLTPSKSTPSGKN